MAQYRVRLVQKSRLSLQELFDTLADHEQLGSVLGVPVRRVQDAQGGDVNGIGSVRRIGFGPLSIEETVTESVPQQLIGYRISRGGFPLRNHSGELRFSPTAEGSSVQWTIDFDSALPLAGRLVQAVLARAIGRGLRRLA